MKKILKNKICIGEVLRELMHEKDISAAELGRILEISDSTIRTWRRGKIKPVIDGDLLAVAHFFEVSIEYLCFGTEKFINKEKEKECL